MDIVLCLLGLLLMLLGIAGSFLPVIPGPLTSWFGFLAIYFVEGINMSKSFLLITLGIAVFILILDYVIPAMGAKSFGGSKLGMIGTTVGLVIGLFSPIPFGVIIGPFIGALIGELMNQNDMKIASRAAFGSFLGFLASTFLKFIVAVIFFGYYIVDMVQLINL